MYFINRSFCLFKRLASISLVACQKESHCYVFLRVPTKTSSISNQLNNASTVAQGRSTIFALSSGYGICGVAVVRVSGPAACDTVMTMTRIKNPPKPRYAVLHSIFNPSTGEMIDRGLVLFFPGPKSFTGEDVAEFHVHGGQSVLSAMMLALGTMPNLRQAEPGEFTKRAFLSGKMDLAEVEGLADLLHAQTDAQRRQALRQMEGDLSKLYNSWRQQLLKCMANVEAFIDFSEDGHLEEDVMEQVTETVAQLAAEIQNHLLDNRRGERLRSGAHVVIIGKPNVGKSSLMNLMCQKPAAIVSPVAGTTRDIVESAVDIGGYPVIFSDTAGLRHTEDIIEKEGVQRALRRTEQADVRVVVTEASILDHPEAVSTHFESLVIAHLQELGIYPSQSQTDQVSASDDLQATSTHSYQHPSAAHHSRVTQRSCVPNFASRLGLIQEVAVETFYQEIPREAASQVETIIVFNKQDLLTRWDGPLVGRLGGLHWCCISCQTNQGIPQFTSLLLECVKAVCGNPGEGNPSLTSARHRVLLNRCLQYLQCFQTSQADCVLAAEQLRRATSCLGKVTGFIATEDILDVIFRDFCIGK